MSNVVSLSMLNPEHVKFQRLFSSSSSSFAISFRSKQFVSYFCGENILTMKATHMMMQVIKQRKMLITVKCKK